MAAPTAAATMAAATGTATAGQGWQQERWQQERDAMAPSPAFFFILKVIFTCTYNILIITLLHKVSQTRELPRACQ